MFKLQLCIFLTEEPKPPDEHAAGVESSELSDNVWTNWGKAIERSVDKCLLEGNHENAHYSPRFANWLIEHIGWLPLWSSVKRDNFGYGRVPASSASVESDFNHLKNRILSDVVLPIRIDHFLEKHLKYIRGNMRIVEASRKDKELSHSDDPDGCLTLETLKSPCTLCTEGNHASAHFCVICRKGVHIVFECSAPVPGQEEGFGQKRVCRSCMTIDSTKLAAIFSSQEIENWRGLGHKTTTAKQRKSRYLRKDFLEHEFVVDDKIHKIPIFKNGDALELKAIKIRNRNISLTNTCGFDSVFQVCLCAMHDRETMSGYVEGAANEFLKLVKNVKEKGLCQNAYRQRAEILSGIFPGKDLPYDVVQVDCRVTAGALCMRLFKSTPSFAETSKCSANCKPRQTGLPAVSIFDYCLKDPKEFCSALEDTIILKGKRRCCVENCGGYRESTISDIGKNKLHSNL